MSDLTIWKYTLSIADSQTLEMPAGARVLSVELQHGRLALWAMVDQTAARVKRTIRVFGTGEPAEAGGTFVGTVQMHAGSLVWHVFDSGEDLA